MQPPILSYYDPHRPTIVSNDACIVSHGADLFKKDGW